MDNSCYHCGDTISEDPIRWNDKDFCCQGCQTVCQILEENNLGKYYTLEKQPGTKQKQTETNYAYLDDPGTFAQLVDFAHQDYASITLELPAIHCTSCLWLLENLHRLSPGIRGVEVNFPRKQATIAFNKGVLPLSQLAALLHRIGYPPKLTLDKVERKKKLPAADRVLLYRLGVAGFCFGNVMLLSFPDYLDQGAVQKEYLMLFTWLSVALSLPALFYAGWDYLRNSWLGIRHRQFVIDQPLALGMVVMLVQSLYEILTDTGTGYLDTLCGLVFFLLLGKFFQDKSYRFLAFDRDYKSFLPLSANRIAADEQETSVLVRDLKPGDRIRVRNEEVIPADALLESPHGQLDYSFATGESEPVMVETGQTVFAGARVVGTSQVLRVLKHTSQSHISKLWNHPAFKKIYTGTHTHRINRLSKYFTIGILLVATAAAAYWSLVQPGKALFAFSAVLIIACPCALALSTPFTYGHLTRILGHNGLYLKNSQVVEALADADTLVFDKTGTLTENSAKEIKLEGSGLIVTDDTLAAVRAVARQSTHPLSQMIANRLSSYPAPKAEATAVVEHPGLGIEGRVNGYRIRLGNSAFAGVELPQQANHVHLSVNDNYLGSFHIHSQYRQGMDRMAEALEPLYSLHILSGDQAQERGKLQQIFGPRIPMSFGQKPDDKLHYMEQLKTEGKKAVMLGDGLNDAGALKTAHAGIAVTEDIGAFAPAADAILDARQLHRLPALLALSRRSRRVVQACTAFSLAYNLIGLAFAVQGELSPLVAAILMPISSIAVVSLSTILSYRQARKVGLGLISTT